MRYLRSGKVKDIYQVGEERLLMVFTDRLSSHDVMLADRIPFKGEVLCRLSAHSFTRCEAAGISTHMLEVTEHNRMVVKKLEIVPIEVIGRRYVYGSYWRRFLKGEVELPPGTEPILAARLTEPVLEFTTKFELEDRPVTEREILDRGWLRDEELQEVKRIALQVGGLMEKDAERGGLILADFKLEFGREGDGRLLLGDEAETPDSCRLWDAQRYKPGERQESFDKQIVRDYLEKTLGWDRHQPAHGSRLTEPILPKDIVDRTSRRYIEAYERLTGERFRQLDAP